MSGASTDTKTESTNAAGEAVTLSEWQTADPEPGSPLAGLNFDRHPQARLLAETLSARRQVEILELAGGLRVRALSFIGRVQLGPLTLTIEPKLPRAPFFHLLGYAYGLRHLTPYDEAGYQTRSGTFQDLLIHQLAMETAGLLGRGIHRDYVAKREDLTHPRGRIDFSSLALRSHRASATLPCVHHPRTEDHILNQALLAGVHYAAARTTDPDLRARLNRLAGPLCDHVTVYRLTADLLQRAARRQDRQTSAYLPALRLVGLLLDGQGISLDSSGSRNLPLSGFLFDMNRFFQDLISRFLHDHLTGYEVHDQFQMRDLFAYDRLRNPCGRGTHILKPDFMIGKAGRPLAILDAKYRDLWATRLPREMLYQLALYALGSRSRPRRSVILYPTTDHAATDQAILVHDPISSAREAEVILRPVDLHLLHLRLSDRTSTTAAANFRTWANQMAFGTASPAAVS